jgi:hypothetical protein
MRYLGMDKKVSFGGWFRPFFRLLVSMRKLRGTKLDLFGYTEIRRTERADVGRHLDEVEALGACHLEGVAGGEDADLLALIADHTNLRDADALIHTVFGSTGLRNGHSLLARTFSTHPARGPRMAKRRAEFSRQAEIRPAPLAGLSTDRNICGP